MMFIQVYYKRNMEPWILIIVFILSGIMQTALKFLGEKYNFCDFPSKLLKIHKSPVSYLGGVGIFVVFWIAILSQWTPVWLISLLGFSGFFLLFGLFDDLFWKKTEASNPFLKLIFEVALIILFLLCSIFYLQIYDLWILGLLGLLWIMLIMNSVNMADGHDGLCATLILISLAGFFITFKLQGNSSLSMLAAFLFSSILGFLILNFPPAKIFMGDNGTHFIGFMMAIFGMLLTIFNFSLAAIVSSILIIGLPVFDLVFVVTNRFLRKKSIIRGDRDHLYDRLYRKSNGNIYKTLLIYGFIQAILVSAGVLLIIL